MATKATHTRATTPNPDPTRLTIFYDGECRFCSRQVNLISDHLGGQVCLVSTSSPEGRVANGLNPTRTTGEIVVQDTSGQQWGGSEAIARLLRESPRYALIGQILVWPIVRPFARIGYRLVARFRHLLA